MRKKGVDLLIAIMPQLSIKENVQLIVLGPGANRPTVSADAPGAITQQIPANLRVSERFTEPLAHPLYGGSDIFLMPFAI